MPVDKETIDIASRQGLSQLSLEKLRVSKENNARNGKKTAASAITLITKV